MSTNHLVKTHDPTEIDRPQIGHTTLFIYILPSGFEQLTVKLPDGRIEEANEHLDYQHVAER